MTALRHITICDLSGQLAGAGATRYLAAFGARVIRVEDPVHQGRWDITRGSSPYRDERRGIELGGTFNNHNPQKLGVTINLRTEEGKDLLRRLVAVSDVVTENFAAGVMARLGFSYEELCKIKPDIIYVANSGFGAYGPYSGFKSFGPVVQAVSGLTFGVGRADDEPAGWGISYMDHLGADYMALAVLSALAYRNRTGEGQYVDMSCTDAGVGLTGPDLLDYTVNNRPLRRPGMPDSNHSNHPPMAPHGIYPTDETDRWIAISCRDDEDWRAIAKVCGEEWASDGRFASLAGRLELETELDALIEGWTVHRERHHLSTELRAAGVPAAPVAIPPEREDKDADNLAWGLFPEVSHPEIGDVRVDGIPAHMSETDWTISASAPTLGQHNRDVFCGILGLSEDELDELQEKGAI